MVPVILHIMTGMLPEKDCITEVQWQYETDVKFCGNDIIIILLSLVHTYQHQNNFEFGLIKF